MLTHFFTHLVSGLIQKYTLMYMESCYVFNCFLQYILLHSCFLAKHSLNSVSTGLKNLLRSNYLGALEVFGLYFGSTKYRRSTLKQCALPFNGGAI